MKPDTETKDVDGEDSPHVTGKPTKPEVDKLMAKWESMPAEMFISYAEIEDSINCARQSCRYKTVVYAWRKRLKSERNVVLYAVATKGFKVADNSTRVSISAGGYKQGLRKIGRASAIAATTEDEGLDDQERRARDHVVMIAAKLKQHALYADRELKLPLLRIKKEG